ncbi:hypothetical protein SAMN05216267_101456 [Actinacidiphila rubida]|uniref:Uncharacterized protein n=1 Tax=Actinacidiphila rubida TaxID=310780 RepID=A0A1H8KWK9_9ACTN|nr:hypothetical protein SAMN05216267_101456 [Actinacidiphila rubida]
MTAVPPSDDPLSAGPGDPAPVPAAVSAVLGSDEPARHHVTRLTHRQLTQGTGGVWRVSGPNGSAVVKVCGAGTDGTPGGSRTTGGSRTAPNPCGCGPSWSVERLGASMCDRST